METDPAKVAAGLTEACRKRMIEGPYSFKGVATQWAIENGLLTYRPSVDLPNYNVKVFTTFGELVRAHLLGGEAEA